MKVCYTATAQARPRTKRGYQEYDDNGDDGDDDDDDDDDDNDNYGDGARKQKLKRPAAAQGFTAEGDNLCGDEGGRSLRFWNIRLYWHSLECVSIARW